MYCEGDVVRCEGDAVSDLQGHCRKGTFSQILSQLIQFSPLAMSMPVP